MSAVMEYKSPCCGAGLQFDSRLQKLACSSCGNAFDMEAVEEYNRSVLTGEDRLDWEDYQKESGSGDWAPGEKDGMRAFICPSYP